MLCLSHRATISCIDTLASNHDGEVLDWKNWLTKRLEEQQSQDVSIIKNLVVTVMQMWFISG